MNGRVYDPELGVFLSPDSIIQAAGASQNYNRYSYVWNNPLRYSDPSGYFLEKVHKSALIQADPTGHLWERDQRVMQNISPQQAQVVSVVLSYIPGIGPVASAAFSAVWAMHNGASDKYILFSAAVSYVSGQIGGGVQANYAGPALGGYMVSGMMAGGFSGGMYALYNGENVTRGTTQGAARGAQGGFIAGSISIVANAMMQPEGVDGNRLEQRRVSAGKFNKEMEDAGVSKGELTADQVAELNAATSNKEFKDMADPIFRESVRTGDETTIIRAYRSTAEEGSVSYKYYEIAGTPCGNTCLDLPDPIQVEGFEYAFDWHPHPHGNRPSSTDYITSAQQGKPGVIWRATHDGKGGFSATRHDQVFYIGIKR